MKNNRTRWWGVWAVLLVVYNVVVFAVPFVKTAVFWVEYLFTMVAICAQIYVIRVAFSEGQGARSKFYGFPIARVGAIYLIAQLALGLICMALSAVIPLWAALILSVLLLGFGVVGFVAADATRDEVQRQDQRAQANTSYMRALQTRVSTLISMVQDEGAAKALSKFADELRYSDPVSGDALHDIEADLTACVEELQAAVSDGDHAAVITLCQKANAILAERNRMCKSCK